MVLTPPPRVLLNSLRANMVGRQTSPDDNGYTKKYHSLEKKKQSLLSVWSPTRSTTSCCGKRLLCKLKHHCLVQSLHSPHFAKRHARPLLLDVDRGWWSKFFCSNQDLAASLKDLSVSSVATTCQAFLTWPPRALRRGSSTTASNSASGSATWSSWLSWATSWTSASSSCSTLSLTMGKSPLRYIPSGCWQKPWTKIHKNPFSLLQTPGSLHMQEVNSRFKPPKQLGTHHSWSMGCRV